MSLLLRPFTLFWILLILSFGLYKLRYRKTCRVFAVIAFAELFLFSCTPFPTWLVKKLESQYKPYSAYGKAMPVLILGGSHSSDPALNDLEDLSSKALARLCEGLRLYNNKAANKFITSGRKADNTVTALTMAKSALMLGVNPADTLMMVRPNTTWEEAIYFKKRFGTADEFILVTSAAHMPRAMEVFKRMGMKPVAAPCDFLVKNDYGKSPYSWGPSLNKLYCSETAIHEYIGILYYRWFKKQ